MIVLCDRGGARKVIQLGRTGLRFQRSLRRPQVVRRDGKAVARVVALVITTLELLAFGDERIAQKDAHLRQPARRACCSSTTVMLAVSSTSQIASR